MTTSLSTMATTLSMDCTAALAAVPRNSAPSISGRRQSESLVFTFTITLNAFVEEALYFGAGDAAETLQNNLEEDAMVAFFVLLNVLTEFVIGNPVTVDQAQFPAAVVVLETTEGFQGTVAVVVILPTADGVPLRHDRPHHREIVLFDLVVVFHETRLAFDTQVTAAHGPCTTVLVVTDLVIAIAITGVDDLVRVVFRLVVEHRTARTRAAAVRVPVVVGSGAPIAVPAIFVLQCVRRNVGVRVLTSFRVDTRQLDFAVLEVDGLTDADTLAFETVVFNPAVGHAQG